jgi:glycosyltransferase involved in cell wall biosynthesis
MPAIDAEPHGVICQHRESCAALHPVTMISTPLPPALCGIGSYTAMLARSWPEPRQVVHFVTSGAEASRREIPTSPIIEVRANAHALSDALGELTANDVLLQYAARGFSRLGVPFWLLRGLRQWKRKVPNRRLAIFIHELWADLPLTHRRGVLERLGRHIIRELAALSDVVITNTAHHQQRLVQMLGGREVETVPVGTNIQPPTEIVDIRQRNRKAFVIFGRAFGRVQTLQKLYDHLRQWHATGSLRELHLVGPLEDRWEREEAALLLKVLPCEAIHRHGPLPDTAVSRILSTSAFALSGQARESLMKSTTFMAFASHGCCVIDAELGARDEDPGCSRGLMSACGFDGTQEAMNTSAGKAATLREWHENHASWSTIAGRVAATFSNQTEV